MCLCEMGGDPCYILRPRKALLGARYQFIYIHEEVQSTNNICVMKVKEQLRLWRKLKKPRPILGSRWREEGATEENSELEAGSQRRGCIWGEAKQSREAEDEKNIRESDVNQQNKEMQLRCRIEKNRGESKEWKGLWTRKTGKKVMWSCAPT